MGVSVDGYSIMTWLQFMLIMDMGIVYHYQYVYVAVAHPNYQRQLLATIYYTQVLQASLQRRQCMLNACIRLQVQTRIKLNRTTTIVRRAVVQVDSLRIENRLIT